MTTEYVASLNSRHQLMKYTLSNNIEVILNEEELAELFKGSKLGKEIESLKAENQKLEYQKEYYKSLIKNFNNILTEMKGV
jgi:hypothetical protein